MVLIERIIELEKAEDEHREHNRIGYANQTKMIRWELQGLLQDECEGIDVDAGENTLPIQCVFGSVFLVKTIGGGHGEPSEQLVGCFAEKTDKLEKDANKNWWSIEELDVKHYR